VHLPSRRPEEPVDEVARRLHAALEGTIEGLYDFLHLDVVAFCRERRAPLKTVQGPAEVAAFLRASVPTVESWIVRPGRDGLVAHGLVEARLAVTIDVRLSGERAVGLLIQTF
jgi:hypothetical protein